VPELFRADDTGIVLAVHVQPAAGRTEVVGRHGDALKVKVGAPPTDGRANAAVLALVAEEFGVPASSVSLVAGGTARAKRIRVAGVDAEQAKATLERMLGAHRPPAGGTARRVDRPRRAT
jgi:uncharacterized protein (TIGR00251 family)